jgi:hypothetical protein
MFTVSRSASWWDPWADSPSEGPKDCAKKVAEQKGGVGNIIVAVQFRLVCASETVIAELPIRQRTTTTDLSQTFKYDVMKLHLQIIVRKNCTTSPFGTNGITSLHTYGICILLIHDQSRERITFSLNQIYRVIIKGVINGHLHLLIHVRIREHLGGVKLALWTPTPLLYVVYERIIIQLYKHFRCLYVWSLILSLYVLFERS